MARYSRRRGPPSNSNYGTGPKVLIPGLTLTRFFDSGELLIAYRVALRNIGVATGIAQTAVHVDGVVAGPTIDAAPTLAVGDTHHMSDTLIHPITAGIHTIEVMGVSDVAATIRADANGSHLSVIQLPQWDSPDDIL